MFDAATLRDGLQRITTDNAQGELYLTDVLSIARKDGKRVGVHITDRRDADRGRQRPASSWPRCGPS